MINYLKKLFHKQDKIPIIAKNSIIFEIDSNEKVEIKIELDNLYIYYS